MPLMDLGFASISTDLCPAAHMFHYYRRLRTRKHVLTWKTMTTSVFAMPYSPNLQQKMRNDNPSTTTFSISTISAPLHFQHHWRKLRSLKRKITSASTYSVWTKTKTFTL